MESSKKHATVMGRVDLAPDMPGLQLQMGNLVIEPGGEIGMHSHGQRPGLGYVLEGTLEESTADGSVRAYGPGDVLTESRDVTHSARNPGTSRTVLLSVHITKER